jgi:tetratricopeptide (TPR) repeat protein
MGNSGGKLSQFLAKAGALYERCAWEAAGERYQKIVQEFPDCAEAWFWLGMLSLRINDPESAALFFEQAHGLGLQDPACLANLGEAYRRSGNAAAAQDALLLACAADSTSYGAWFNLASLYAEAGCFDLALERIAHLERQHPGDVRLLTMKGEICKNQGQLDEAVASFEKVLTLNPGHLEAQLGLADTLRVKKEYSSAMAGYEAVLRQDQNNLGALNGLAGVAVGLSDEKGAEAFYRQALEIAPVNWESLIGLGMELTSRRRFDDAIEVLKQATAAHPKREDAWMRLGEAYFHSDRLELALESYLAALEKNPDHASSLVGVGNVYIHQRRWGEAVPVYKKATELAPYDYRILSNIALALAGLDELDEAEHWGLRAVELAGDAADACFVRFNLSAIDLIRGNLDRGWLNYDFRPSVQEAESRFACPYWQGESLAGKRILIWQDQGVGDQLLFSTIFNEVIEAAGKVVIECEGKLLSLIRRSFPRAKVVPRSRVHHPLTLENYDFHCASGSLPRWFRSSIEAFPAEGSAPLHLDDARVDYWKERIAGLSNKPKVGVCWRSSVRSGMRNHCYAEISDWAGIFALSGVTLVNLQYDECQAELAEIRQTYDVELASFPELDMYNDLDETCAMISQLDAVITAPTAISRQAGALGIRTYLMTVLGDWTSLGQHEDPWMPNVLKYYRAGNDAWSTPFSLAIDDLKAHFGLTA